MDGRGRRVGKGESAVALVIVPKYYRRAKLEISPECGDQVLTLIV